MTTEGTTLQGLLVSHQEVLQKDLDCRPVLLDRLVKKSLLNQNQIKEIKGFKYRDGKVAGLLRMLALSPQSQEPGSSDAFVSCLFASGQPTLAKKLPPEPKPEKIDMDTLEKYQSDLEDYLEEVESYIQKESRRAGVNLPSKEEPAHSDPPDGATEMEVLLYGVRSTTRTTLQQLAAFQCVIDKLREDCRAVAKSNATILKNLQQCGQLIKPFGKPEDKSGSEDHEENNPAGNITPPSGRRAKSVSSKSRQDEADLIVKSVKYDVGHLKDRLNLMQQDHDKSFQLLIQLERQLNKQLQKSGKSFFLTELDTSPSEEEPDQTSSKYIPIHSRIEKLTDNLQTLGYLKDEPKLIHRGKKFSIGSGAPPAGVPLKTLGEIEASWRELGRAVRRGDRGVDVASRMDQLARSTWMERDHCLRVLNNLQRQVRDRKLHLAASTKTKSPRRPIPPVQLRALDTNFSKKLNELSLEIDDYIEQERLQTRALRDQAACAKETYEAELERRDRQIKDLRQRLGELPKDLGEPREKEHERDSSKDREAAILMKPVLLKRQDKGSESPGHAQETSRPAGRDRSRDRAPAPPMPHSTRLKDGLLVAV